MMRFCVLLATFVVASLSSVGGVNHRNDFKSLPRPPPGKGREGESSSELFSRNSF